MREKHCFWWIVAGALLVLLGVGLYPVIRSAGSVVLLGGILFFIIWLTTCIEQFDEWVDELFNERDR
jgi:hypothetical protein